MKRSVFFSKILLFSAVAVALTSCDDISEDDRYIDVDLPPVARKVLVAEFSGIRCSNCPDGARTLHSLQESFPGSVIAVNLQPQGMNLTRPIGNFSLENEEAKKYYDYFSVAGLPAAVIDGAAPINLPVNWSAPIIAALGEESNASVSLISAYDEESRKGTFNYKVLFNDSYAPEVSVLVWVVENGIIGPQIDGTSMVMEYEHNHVFRGSANGLWGKSIGSNFAVGSEAEGTAEFSLDPSYVAENCQVIAFAFNSSSKEVLQSEIVDLIAK